MSTNVNYTKFIINKNDVAYKLRDQLKTFGIYYDFEKKYYCNNSIINEPLQDQLIWFCQKFDLSYKTEEIKSNNDLNLNKYKILTIDKNNFLIEQVFNNLKCYFITIYNGMDKNIVNILDIRKSLHLTATLPEFESSDYLFEILKYFTYNKDEIFNSNFQNSDLFSILPNLVDSYSLDLKKEEKLEKFKYKIIQEIVSKNQNGFLCNCVPGFFPETEFYILGNRIKSSLTDNFISYNQEKKILEYLFKKENRKYIGKWREPTYYELFVGNKILVKDKSGTEFLAKITSVKDINGKFQITISNGNKEAVVPKYFDKDELFLIVKQYNR